MTDHPPLGTPVRFTWSLRRRAEWRPTGPDRHGRPRDERWKIWTPYDYLGQTEPRPTEGLLIGVRTLSNGPTFGDYDAGEQYDDTRAERFTAYLVAWHLYRRPALVLPKHLTTLTLVAGFDSTLTPLPGT